MTRSEYRAVRYIEKHGETPSDFLCKKFGLSSGQLEALSQQGSDTLFWSCPRHASEPVIVYSLGSLAKKHLQEYRKSRRHFLLPLLVAICIALVGWLLAALGCI